MRLLFHSNTRPPANLLRGMTIPSTHSNYSPSSLRPDSQAGWLAKALGLKLTRLPSKLAAEAVVRCKHGGFAGSRGAGREEQAARPLLSWLVVLGLQEEAEGGEEQKLILVHSKGEKLVHRGRRQ